MNVPKSVETVGENAFGYITEDGQEFEKNDDFSMSVYSGSGALKYARENGIDHTVADRNIKQIAFIIIAVGLVVAVIVFAVVLMARNKKSASVSAKKAKKLEEQQRAEDSYEKIVGDDK